MRSTLWAGTRVAREISSTLSDFDSRSWRRKVPTVGIGAPRLLELLQHGAAFFSGRGVSRQGRATIQVSPSRGTISELQPDAGARRPSVLKRVTPWSFRFQCPRKGVQRRGE